MSKFFVIFILLAGTAFADRIVIDTTMAASKESEHIEYQDRGSFGPYVGFGNIKMKNVTYNYRVHGLEYDISIVNSNIYGASGSLPITEWFGIYLMAGYQYLGVTHHPHDRDEAYADWNALREDFFDPPFSETDMDGHHDIHTALFQFGFDLSLPLIYSYRHQFMLKLFAFGGTLVGKTFFLDDTQFLSPVLYGYAYGTGIRIALHGWFLSAGTRNSHGYFHTYYERKTGAKKDGDEFMLDYDTYFEPFVSFGVTLF